MKEEFNIDTRWAIDEGRLRHRWQMLLKYETLDMLVDLKRNDVKSSDREFKQHHEADARTTARDKNIRLIRRVLQPADGYEKYITTLFLRSISSSFDPHSTYLSPTQMENFISSLSTQGYYFGISITESGRGDIVIDHLTPGGPAWKSGEVRKGDIIEQIRWENENWVPLSGMTEEEVNDLVSRSNHHYLEFIIRRPEGSIKTIRLRTLLTKP